MNDDWYGEPIGAQHAQTKTLGWAVVASHPEQPSYLVTGPGSTFWASRDALQNWAGYLISPVGSGWNYTVVRLVAEDPK